VGTAKVPKTRKKQYWDYHRKSAIFVPVNVRATVDLTKYYIKSPNEMTRPELAQLERELREIEEEEEEMEKQNIKVTDPNEEEDDAKEDELRRGQKKRAIRKAQKEANKAESLIEDEEEEEEDKPKKFEIPQITFSDLDKLKYAKVKQDPDFIEYVN
jgi:hypothetical protein